MNLTTSQYRATGVSRSKLKDLGRMLSHPDNLTDNLRGFSLPIGIKVVFFLDQKGISYVPKEQVQVTSANNFGDFAITCFEGDGTYHLASVSDRKVKYRESVWRVEESIQSNNVYYRAKPTITLDSDGTYSIELERLHIEVETDMIGYYPKASRDTTKLVVEMTGESVLATYTDTKITSDLKFDSSGCLKSGNPETFRSVFKKDPTIVALDFDSTIKKAIEGSKKLVDALPMEFKNRTLMSDTI